MDVYESIGVTMPKHRLFYPTVAIEFDSPTPEEEARMKALQARADDIAKNLTIYAIDERSEECIIPEKEPD